MNRLMLAGCTPQPLGSYLKGLAVLRLVSEQADETARGSWEDDCFVLETTLDRESLIEFFLKRYSPTAVIAPWNGGSGFYPKDRKVGIDALAESDDSRFALYRRAIGNAQEIVRETGEEKGASKNDEDARRLSILRLCRNRLPDGCVDWLDAAIAISSEGARAFAPILGTGGNEGRLDYTNNFL
jgi:CRISPR-associated protein Csx17